MAIKKISLFVTGNWFKIAILIFLLSFLVILKDVSNGVFEIADKDRGVNSYYQAKFQDEYLGLPSINP
jgi:hypothetical protein